jgi:hypothetical protein
MVRLRGIEPQASCVSSKRSAAELKTRVGAPSRIRTSEMSVCKTDALGLLANGASIGARGKLRTCTGRDLKPLSLPVGLRARARGAIRTRNRRGFKPPASAIGLHGRSGAPSLMKMGTTASARRYDWPAAMPIR